MPDNENLFDKLSYILFENPDAEDRTLVRKIYFKYLAAFEVKHGSQWFKTEALRKFPAKNSENYYHSIINKAKVQALVNQRRLRREEKRLLREEKQLQENLTSLAMVRPRKIKTNSAAASVNDVVVRVGQRFYKYFYDANDCYRGKIVERKKSGNFLVEFTIPERFKCFKEEIAETNIKEFILTGRTVEEAEAAYKIGICQGCQRATDSQCLIMCVLCQNPVHNRVPCMNYLQLQATNDRDFFCEECVREKDSVNLYGFGFSEGPEYSLPEYKALNRLLLEEFDLYSSDELTEEEYYSALNNSGKPLHLLYRKDLEVQYGSDLDSSVLGSGFAVSRDSCERELKLKNLKSEISTMETGSDNANGALKKLVREIQLLEKLSEDERHPWNVTNIPKANGSLLQFVEEDITGVKIPWVYMGMKYSSFCFHTEDHYFASINYHHTGAAKTWFGIPGHQAHVFEEACRQLAPELFELRKDLLAGIVTQFQVKDLMEAAKLLGKELDVYHVKQEPGEFVITFPRAYHGGFNHGFNCAEAVNFATASWIPFGLDAFYDYRILRKIPVINYEQFIYKLCKLSLDTKSMSQDIVANLFDVLRKLLQREEKVRNLDTTRGLKPEVCEKLKEGNQICSHCNTFLYFSCFFWSEKYFCVDHLPEEAIGAKLLFGETVDSIKAVLMQGKKDLLIEDKENYNIKTASTFTQKKE
eukprot:augustus_masked-scaffold_1-processed-gene-28.40-mRNA-1 protein AED:0.64 eAED:0.68 QI:0/-1/0/1/-1/1/1/0/699